MKTHNTVKTEKKAIELINDELEFSGLSFDDGILEDTSIYCECGETNAVKWTDCLGNSDKLIICGICESCGDDDHMRSDVIVIL